MPLSLTIAELLPRFPQFRTAIVLFEGLAIPPERPLALDAEIARREAECRARHAGTELSAIPGVAAWRSAYKGFGIRKTSYRSSVERLVKRVMAGERLPSINPFVDCYNAVSLHSVLCVGADDVARIAPPVAFRYARPGDSFLDMAAEGEEADDPPKEGEVVLADRRHVLCRRWNWRQDMRSAIAPTTGSALITIQANGWGDLEAALADLRGLVAQSCGGTSHAAIADQATPAVALGLPSSST